MIMGGIVWHGSSSTVDYTQEAEKAKMDVLRRKEQEARLSEINVEITTLQAEKKAIEEELVGY